MSDSSLYFMSDHIGKNPPGLVLVNESKILTGDHLAFGLHDPSKRGIPLLPEPPILDYKKSRGRPPQDVETFRDFFLLSKKAKETFEQLDAEAFEFSQCVMLENGNASEQEYWLCDVVRVLDALDEENSDVKIGEMRGRKFYFTTGATNFHFKPDKVGNHDVFVMDHCWSWVVCSPLFRRNCEKNKLKNIQFRDMTTQLVKKS